MWARKFLEFFLNQTGIMYHFWTTISDTRRNQCITQLVVPQAMQPKLWICSWRNSSCTRVNETESTLHIFSFAELWTSSITALNQMFDSGRCFWRRWSSRSLEFSRRNFTYACRYAHAGGIIINIIKILRMRTFEKDPYIFHSKFKFHGYLQRAKFF